MFLAHLLEHSFLMSLILQRNIHNENINTIKHLHVLVHHYNNVIVYVLIMSMNGNAINKTELTCCGTSVCLQPSFLVYLFLLFWLSYPLKDIWKDIGLNCLSTCAKNSRKGS